MSKAKFPGWRTMTASQRYNTKMEAMFEDAKARGVTGLYSGPKPEAAEPIVHYVECGCCGHFHRPEYRGDCRNDSERYTAELLDERHGENGWTYESVEDQMEAEKAETEGES